MTQYPDPLEARLSRVLARAADQVPVVVPDPVRAVPAPAQARGRLPTRALGGLAVLLALAVGVGAVATLGHRRAASAGRPASAPALAGRASALRARLAALRGRPVVVFVWASWCEPCRGQFALVASAARRLRATVAFVGVDEHDTRASALAALRQTPLGFPSYAASVSTPAVAVPTFRFLGSDGRLEFEHLGAYPSMSALDADIDRLLTLEPDRPPRQVTAWPDAPPSQPGAWREGGDLCPLAPPNPYLPARAGCVSAAIAGVAGGGGQDLVLLYGQLGRQHRAAGYVPIRFWLEIRRAQGGILRTDLHLPPVAPTLIAIRAVNGRPGAELFVRDVAISSGESATVYAFDGTRIRAAGELAYGGDSGLQAGFTCQLGSPATITQWLFVREGAGVWRESAITYTWFGARLRRTASRTAERRGLPPAALTRPGC